ncbi:DUF3363 domain-containing protein [Paremcibacter congregatus]|uniref:DUF3363 domain-containing protein n=1 Tax=Paremcibacter congregatus TaxID=2043170 RepID=UPI003A933726
MSKNSENPFKPRLGKGRALGGKQGKRFLNRALSATKRAGGIASGGGVSIAGSSFGRGRHKGRFGALHYGYTHSSRRRVVVKARIVKLGSKGLAAAKTHLGYLTRGGVDRRTGEEELGKGVFYDAEADRVEGGSFLERAEEDRHQFRFIVSPEDAHELESLKPFIRDLMQQAEEDLGTRLDWIAVDHHDTDNPHTHVLLRGKDDRGEDLVISRDYISRGMRDRASELMTLELGPRNAQEIRQAMTREVAQDRLTSLDQRLKQAARDGDIHLPLGQNAEERQTRSLLIARLQKLERMGLAKQSGAHDWHLASDFDAVLKREGLRGDIIKTLHRSMADHRTDHSAGGYAIFDPQSAQAITGRVMEKGLADELKGSYYLIVDGVDGKAHYVEAGNALDLEDYPDESIVEVTARSADLKPADHIIDEIAKANKGLYSEDIHTSFDKTASRRFVETHIRRLELLRRQNIVERHSDGTWSVPRDYLERARLFEERQAKKQPVQVALKSGWSIAQQKKAIGATWLDQALAAGEAQAVGRTGFGADVQAALEERRDYLMQEGLAEKVKGTTKYRRQLLAYLKKRELEHAAGKISEETGLAYKATRTGDAVEGIYQKRLTLASGRYALIEGAKEFTLVPWRPVLERARGAQVSGMMRSGASISWHIGRGRGL